jgi:hypothetical protein
MHITVQEIFLRITEKRSEGHGNSKLSLKYILYQDSR